MTTPDSLNQLPQVVDVADQPCQQLYERNPVLLGFDVVQYHFIPAFLDGGVAVRGIPEHAYNFEGYQFWFSTEKNRNLFINDPWKYAPAWGGFCSWGIARELPPQWPWAMDYLGPPASPWEGWLIQDGTLIFNIWASYSDLFLNEADSNMMKASDRWEGWFGTLQAGPFNTHCIGHGTLKNWCIARQPSPWMQPLPNCTVVQKSTNTSSTNSSGIDCSVAIESGGILHENCSDVTVDGGGVVSSAGEYDDFAKARYSPHQQMIIKVVASLGFIFVLFALLMIVFRKRVRAVCCKERTSQKQDEVPNKLHEDSFSESSPSQETASSAAMIEGDVAVPLEDEP